MSEQPDRNFQWLYATAQSNATLGTSYSYGEGQLPSWAMTGEYGNGGATSTGRTEYIWLPTDDGSAIPVGMFRSNRFYAIHTDHLGTPRLVTDDTAKPVWQWAYSAFGDNKPTGVLKATTNPNTAFTSAPLLAATNPAVVLNFRLPGQYWDSETGFAQNYMREYMSSQGRYTQPDPIGLGGGWNQFGYVGGNPLSLIDPEGLAGKNPKDFGKGVPVPDMGKLPQDTTKNTKQQQELKEPGADTVKSLACQLGFKNCDLENELKKARMCVLSECTTCDGLKFLSGPKAPNVSAFDPSTTKCVCIQYGFNPDYKGGPPPGLTPPGR